MIKKNSTVVSSSAKIEIQQGNATTERFVAFLDIMGFKDLVARNNHANILSQLLALTDFISEKVGVTESFHFSMFSDSIIIYSDSTNFKDFETIIILTSSIINKSISIGLPIKGAIAKGVCTATTGEKLLYFGQPIIDAFKLEENIVLYGVAIHNTAEQEAIDLCQKTGYTNLYDFKVILKSSSSNHYIVNWYGDDTDYTIQMLTNIRKTVSDTPRRYIDNTIDAIRFLKKDSKNV